MPSYKAPLDDIRFVLDDVLDVQQLSALPGYEDATPETIAAVLEEAAKVCEEVLAPLNQSGDAEGVKYENGAVTTPSGFKEAYRTFIEGGWTAISSDAKYGGQGLPLTVRTVLDEMLCAANLSFSMYPLLGFGAYEALMAVGSDELKDRYLPKLVSGEWGGTMCLTEPHAGTDLGLLTTKAVPAGDGAYKVTGTKIFITAGEHDLTDNIIHLVLAKLPDAPPGVKGISLFVVPKFLPTEEGKPGTFNDVRCGSVEHKMGIKASATCVMNFENSTGWMVGEPHKGLRAMFIMMNGARLGVGIQGLGVAEAAYQNSVLYAKDRLQGRALTGTKQPSTTADPIIVHPDVRRGLLFQKAFTEGARAFAYWIGMHLDIEHSHPDATERQRSADLVALLTPVVKAFLTDYAFESTNVALQTYGGHGYVREYGMEQFVRDARITQIYEGTNGVQALDLVGRKLPQDGGRLLRAFFHPMNELLEAHKDDESLKEFVEPLGKAFQRLQQATGQIAMKGLQNPDEAAAVASDYLHLFGLNVLGYMWLRMVVAAKRKLPASNGDRRFHETKVKTARFYFTKILPRMHAHFAMIMSGGEPIMAVEAEAL